MTMELIEVDPGTLVIGANVRTEVSLGKPFLASIAEHGVKQCIQAYRDAAGSLIVIDGQRRTLAALETGQLLVKVDVIAAPDDAGRIVDQITVTEHRDGMTQADRMHAIEQLSLLGLPASAIAKRTGHEPKLVAAALTAAGSKTTATAVADYDLDLVDAADIAEFADDPEVFKRLVDISHDGGNLKWHVQRARDDREVAAKKAAVVEAVTADGVTVLDKTPDTYSGPIAKLSELTDDKGKKLTPAKHKTCPGHAAFIDRTWKAGTYTPVAAYVCTDFKKHGHTSTASRANGRDTSPEAKAERRAVIAGNRDWKTATGLRRTWLRELLTSKAAPATAAGFIALSLAADSVVADARIRSTNAMAQYLLGVIDEPKSGYESRDAFTAFAEKAGEKRALVIALGIVLGAYEAATTGMEWRSGTSKTAIRYLRYLQALGYDLSPIELQACGEKPVDPDGEPS